MRTLHLRFRPTADPQQVELRYSYEVSSDYQSRRLNLEEIATLIREAETQFYTRFPGDLVRLGQRLYDWLDGSDRWLTQALQDNRRQTLVLAVDLQGRLAHLPWELLHDGESFLVQRRNPRVVPLRWQGDTPSETLPPPAPRPLHLLFMATSPEGVTVLDYEEEEGRILEATRRKPLTLTVEESGCLSELQELLDNYEAGAIDVVHLTGHGTLRDGVPCFVTESEVGAPCYSNAEDLIDSFGTRMPSLLFLSGCSTGQAQQEGNIPSLAEQLLQEGAKTVLAWGRSVLDGEATAAAAALYGGLAAGDTLADALSKTYQALLKDDARDWYLLRCYGAGTVPEALVMAPRQQRVMPQRPRIRDRNLDPEGRKLVATAGEFVGRRRPIQRSLQALKYDPNYLGVLIYGMGGLGKSTLAKRLADRLSDYKFLVWIDPVDSESLLQRLTQEVGSDPILRQILQDPQDEPKWRLRRAFDYLDEMNQREDQPQTRLLLLFDDFENSLEPRQGGYVPTPEAAAVLEMLLEALSQTPHRLLITSRYQFDSPQLKFLYPQPLDRLDRVEVRKKCQTLSLFSDEPNQRSQRLEPELREQALRLADGYPRLLEWLNQILQDRDINRREILAQLQAERAVELREQVLATALWDQVDEPMRQMLQRGLLYELPVPEAALRAVCEGIGGLAALIDRAKRLGLLEVSPDESLRVPRLLPVGLPEEVELLQAEAAKVLYRLWWDEAESSTEAQRLEIHRLAVAGRQGEIAAKVNEALALKWHRQSRFRDERQLCRQTLTVMEDYKTLHNLARAEKELGDVEMALNHYRQVQEHCPEEDEQERATIIHNMAGIYAQQGQVQEALDLYRQSLDLHERIGDVQGKAASLHQMAGIYAQQGQVQEALDLYRQSLDSEERIGNVQGKATTLGMMAQLLAVQGEVEIACEYMQEAIAIFDHLKSPNAAIAREILSDIINSQT
ncbi:CHAT domain-containing protein [Geitlerinema sp. P-1104]|uniref:CHAT domain-containing protein n=1 Tax=Geitlerinema sp. P-1104 TaxID=2546230 RepID=UPI001476BE34|nr:CHAT domain-containing protein [Geitlerinema sp. P-1104]NMG60311.1 CHAT domain-containing protein [Geitlerinema sp. P-1104]